MNIYEKITVIRDELNKKNLKKSGENTFAKYKYYELADFLPALTELMREHKVFSSVKFGKTMATLKIVNTEKIDESIVFNSQIVKAEVKGCTAIQALGATQTYIRRYLYTVAFDISESDVVDSGEQKVPDKKTSTKTQETPTNQENGNVTDINIISTSQAKRIFAIGKGNEEKIKMVIKCYGYDSTKLIKKSDYENICEEVKIAVS